MRLHRSDRASIALAGLSSPGEATQVRQGYIDLVRLHRADRGAKGG